MSLDQPRHPAGAPTGGQFAAASRGEPALALVTEEGPDVPAQREVDLEAARRYLAHLEATELVLREQHVAAMEARRTAVTARQAREAAGEVGEIDFMRETVALETRVAQHDVDVLTARATIAVSPEAVIADAQALHASSLDLGRLGSLITALDAAVDADELDTHPWLNPRRAELVEDLTTSLEASPHHPAARAWSQQLAVLSDPMHVDRAVVAARRDGTPGALDAAEQARKAQEAVTERLRNGPRTPRLRAV